MGVAAAPTFMQGPLLGLQRAATHAQLLRSLSTFLADGVSVNQINLNNPHHGGHMRLDLLLAMSIPRKTGSDSGKHDKEVPKDFDHEGELLELYRAINECQDIEKLRRGLCSALIFLGNYRSDARGVHAGVRPGYCQGTAYLGAYRLIRKEMA